MNRFEQLIEYVINDEDQKARELFHDIVVEKSREIYEDIMAEESTEDEDEKAEKAGKKVTKDIEYDDKRDRKEKMHEAEDLEEEEDLDEALGGDAADDLIDEVEMDEENDMSMEAEEDEEEMSVDMDMDDEEGDEDDHHADVGGDEELEDRVMDLEDKLDELMAEFEELMGADEGNGDMMPDDEGGDAIEMDDTEVMDVDMDEPVPAMEAVSLKAAPKPVTSEEGSVNKKSVNANNAGARGAMADPVKMTGDTAQGRPAPTTKELIGKVGNTPAQGTQDPKPATKPHLAQATGVNVKSPLPSGAKG